MLNGNDISPDDLLDCKKFDTELQHYLFKKTQRYAVDVVILTSLMVALCLTVEIYKYDEVEIDKIVGVYLKGAKKRMERAKKNEG